MFLFALALISLNQASAKVIVEKVDFPKKVVIVKIEERIIHKEEIEFQKALDQIKSDGYTIKKNAIAFNTRGGSGSSAIKIGKIIRDRRLNTFVSPNSVCASACIYGVIGGVVRNIYGKVSVHRSSYNDVPPIHKIKKFIAWGDYDETLQNYQASALRGLKLHAWIN